METRAPETDPISRIGLLFVYALLRGITQEAKRFGTSNDNDFELPSL